MVGPGIYNHSDCVANSSRGPSRPASVRASLSSVTQYRRLAALLAERDEVLARWSDTFGHTGLLVPGGMTAKDIEPVLSGIVEELLHALPIERADGTVLPGGLSRGSAETRDLEKAAAFAGATMSALGGSGFDMAAALLSLRDVAVATEPDERDAIFGIFEWLTVISLDAYAHAGASAVREKQRVLLEQSTPVVMVTPFLPALMLVGSPDRMGLDAILSRLLLSVVRVGAKIAIIDAHGLPDPTADDVLDSLGGFVNHRKITGRLSINAVGLDREHATAWAGLCRSADVGFSHKERFPDAVVDAFARLGYELRATDDP